MTRPTEDPAVTTWRLALVHHRPDPPPRRHWWRELVTETFQAAAHAREALRESGHLVDTAGAAHAEVAAYQLEPEEFDRLYPAPRLADYMRGLSQGSMAPEGWGVGL